MDHNLWNGVKYEKWPEIHDMYYSIAERHQTFKKIWNGNEVDHGVKWKKCGWMNEMEYGWMNEMENEMDHKWNESTLMIL